MIVKRKKSLSLILAGSTLFILTLILTIPDLGMDRNYEKTNEKSLIKSKSKVAIESRRSINHRGKTQNVTKKRNNPAQESLEKIVQNKPELPSVTANIETLPKQALAQVHPQATTELKRQFPAVIILGVKKAGTRSLLEAMEMHPKVKAAPDEVYYFNGFHSRGLEWYREQMPLSFPGQITVEKSPTYFTSTDTTQVVNRMFVFSRSTPHIIKLLVVVRDPTTRCLSEYTDIIARSTEEEIAKGGTFESFVLNSDGSVNANSSLVKTGLYILHLREWLKHFPKEELHFVSGENLVTNPYKEIKEVESFLGLELFFSEKNFRFDKEKGFPCFVPSKGGKSFCLPPNKGRKHIKVQKRTLIKLREFYRPYNRQFYRTVRRNFFWP